MALNNYEFLVRFNIEDGSFSGAALYRFDTEAQRVTPPVPITSEEMPGVLAEVNTASMEAAVRCAALADARLAQIDELETVVADLRAQFDTLSAQAQAAVVTLNALDAQTQRQSATIEAQEAEIAELTAKLAPAEV